MIFKNKKILFLSARFFHYENAITQQLEKLGAQVDYFDERPSNSVWTKGIIRVNPKMYQKRINSYYQLILKQIQNKKYDYFLLIKGETVPFFFLEKFKKEFPQTQMIFYAYDAMNEYPRMLKLLPFFDRKITFEPSDAIKYKLEFRPLFYLNSYKKSEVQKEKKYDITFIGSAHTDRYQLGETIRELAEKMNLKTHFFYYSPSKIAYYLKRLFDADFKKVKLKKLSFTQLNHQEIQKIYNQSFSVLDINKPFQNGLTMRTFETLAAGKKLITTNPDIRNYPFYNPQNILYINREKIELSFDFFQSDFQELTSHDLEKMSLKSWLMEVFFENDSTYWSIVLDF